MENKQTATEKGKNQKRFEEEKECRLVMLYHSFLSIEDQDWGLLREKLIHMRDRYGSKQALQLCPVCLCLFLSSSLKKHENTSIGSLFLGFDPEKKSPKQIAQVLQDYGRIKVKKNGEILTGFPYFNQMCIPHHSSLKGSIIQDKESKKEDDNQKEQDKTGADASLKKRLPERETGEESNKKEHNDEKKNKIWSPFSKGVIKPLTLLPSALQEGAPTKPKK